MFTFFEKAVLFGIIAGITTLLTFICYFALGKIIFFGAVLVGGYAYSWYFWKSKYAEASHDLNIASKRFNDRLSEFVRCLDMVEMYEDPPLNVPWSRGWDVLHNMYADVNIWARNGEYYTPWIECSVCRAGTSLEHKTTKFRHTNGLRLPLSVTLNERIESGWRYIPSTVLCQFPVTNRINPTGRGVLFCPDCAPTYLGESAIKYHTEGLGYWESDS